MPKKEITYERLKALNLDYYSLKNDAYGKWRDLIYLRKQEPARYTKVQIEAAEQVYRALENTTSVSTPDFDQTFIDELDEVSNLKTDQIADIVNELLESYE
jgi:hypothetical protein